jgi:DNA-binding transcriptional regulator YiaG
LENFQASEGARPHAGHSSKRTAGSRLAHSSFYEPIIERLIAKRKGMGLSQEVVNDLIGCCDALVSKWECRMRYPSAHHLMLWAQVLKMRIFAEDLSGAQQI